MRRKTNVIRLDRIASNVEAFANTMYSNTQGLVKDVSKEISSIKWEGMYKSAQKNIRLHVKRGNRSFSRALRKAKKTNAYKMINRQVPRYYTLFGAWSSVQFRKLKNFTSSRYNQSRKWVRNNSPEIKGFVKQYYPKVENFVLNQIPAYRIVFTKAF